jgi:hypothetical protein
VEDVAGAGRAVVAGAVDGGFRVTVVRAVAGAVDVVEGGVVVVVDVVVAADCSSLTTSLWGRTGAGRSVTSAATVDVAVHTIAVDTRVAANHTAAVNRRDMVTPSRMPTLGTSTG